MQFGAALMGPFFFHQGSGNDAHHLAASRQSGIGHNAHEAISAAAIDQLPTVLGNPLADLHGRFCKA